MPFNDIERQRIENDLADFMARKRPPAHIRPELDLCHRVVGQSVMIFEVRPDWQDRSKTMESAVAKTTFVRSRNHWKIFWMRADLKWHGYEPNPVVPSLADFLAEVEQDKLCCFFG